MEHKVIIIAEAGVNHNGDIDLALKLVDEAKKCGADYVKFQTFKTELIVDRTAPKAAYQNMSVGEEISQFDMIKNLELKYEDFHLISDYCKKTEIKFLTSTGDLESLKKIDEYNLDFIKVPSGELTNPLFLEDVALKGKPIILSTGMGNLGEIESALKIFYTNGVKREDVTILHCNTEYPTPFEDVNLKAMLTIRDAFKTQIGYSDHTLGIEVAIAAVALGATVIEKHFTLDQTMKGPDHKASLNPVEFKKLVDSIRNVEFSLKGSGIKRPSNSEVNNLPIVRKSIFISKNMNSGDTFTKDNLILKRPGTGIPSQMITDVIGKKTKIDLVEGNMLDMDNVLW